MRGDLLDLILIGLVVAFAVSGYRQGFIIGAFSFIGFVGGALLGMFIAPPLAGAIVNGDMERALLAIVIVFLTATLGQFICSTIGAVVRSHVTWEPARVVDAFGGSVASGLSVLLIAWLFGSLIVSMSSPVLKEQVVGSIVWQAVDEAIPDSVRALQKPFKDFVETSEWPQVITSIGGQNVPPPDEGVLQGSPALARARKAIVKIEGTAPSCRKHIEGTGFVYARHRVMTNAHVVAGVTEDLKVIDSTGKRHAATVVHYNPDKDVAVLFVPELQVPALRFDFTAERGEDAIIAGYPKGRGFTPLAARIRTKLRAESDDIYNRRKVERDVYVIRGKVQPGNSGGPLLSTEGRVYGMIFAAATDQEETGYALTAREILPDAKKASAAVARVGTQECD
ncbi:MarP family serine protease [Thermobispora bispora]|uniref:Colicin V production protein n=1 Tax=Thermobispora bispora (strain ATCC 19993 / DSM 43833 / CBS 139.67 / JCM 10125 / KCTC 9307 / NBRC 14880 / R51) TaxID=469371 RepID=D6Y2X8_THEBD|nr:MarP family serine protease [Thermobispora bispora]MBO2474515.1 serine protease [Actinomycetales bacterium]MDI9579256.1 MarP family serine protease [Thermobispora sp.]ADG86939.1 Colicin V production protein [Thermobispora bispora DSM 43833]MBX6168466.1 MarP family serine protease [Thermobispora bispora]QSI46922.1 MarP family serine protease [Thermobispora bispora]